MSRKEIAVEFVIPTALAISVSLFLALYFQPASSSVVAWNR